jgi:hypothetical protein
LALGRNRPFDRRFVFHLLPRQEEVGDAALPGIGPVQVAVEPQVGQVFHAQRADQQDLQDSRVHGRQGRFVGRRFGGFGPLHQFAREVQQHGAGPGLHQRPEPFPILTGHARLPSGLQALLPERDAVDGVFRQLAMVACQQPQRLGDLPGERTVRARELVRVMLDGDLDALFRLHQIGQRPQLLRVQSSQREGLDDPSEQRLLIADRYRPERTSPGGGRCLLGEDVVVTPEGIAHFLAGEAVEVRSQILMKGRGTSLQTWADGAPAGGHQCHGRPSLQVRARPVPGRGDLPSPRRRPAPKRPGGKLAQIPLEDVLPGIG